MNTPESAETLGRILREVSQTREDLTAQISAMRETANERHRTIADEMAEIRVLALRATEVANEAKRTADRSAHDTERTQRAVMEHTRGLAASIQKQDVELAAIKNETKVQTCDLQRLLDAEDERKTREDERAKVEEARWKGIGRWWPIVTASAAGAVTLAAYVVAHWKP